MIVQTNDQLSEEKSSKLGEDEVKEREKRLQRKFKDSKVELTENSGKLTHSDGSSIKIEFEKE